MGLAAAAGELQAIGDAVVWPLGDALVRHRRARHVAQEALAAFAVLRADRRARVEVEALQLGDLSLRRAPCETLAVASSGEVSPSSPVAP
jgi:hypothetical protein